MSDTEIWIGIIMMAVIGPAIGNYATSVVYRLPRGQTPFEKHPYCGSCGTMLAPKDLFPIWSYVLLRGRCRYCQVKIPVTHTWVEVTCLILFEVNFLLYGMSERFLLLTTLGVFLITLATLEYVERRIFSLIVTYCYAIAAIYRTLLDGEVSEWFISGFIALVIAILLWKLAALCKWAAHDKPPAALWLAPLIGILFPPLISWGILLAALALYALGYLFARKIMVPSIAITLAIFAGLWAGY